MTIALMVTITVMIILSLLVLSLIYQNNGEIACMTGMMAAMTLGMMVGLVFGVILGVILTASMFTSTLLAMAVGMIIGFLAGAPISVLAVLDGMLSGMMGGMMGAMLGEMVSLEYQDMLIKIMFVIFIGMVFILLFLLQQELTQKNENTRGSLFQRPLFILVIVCIFFFGYNQLGPTVTISEHHGPKEPNHEGH